MREQILQPYNWFTKPYKVSRDLRDPWTNVDYRVWIQMRAWLRVNSSLFNMDARKLDAH